jgi:hypothetical protein
MGYDIDRLFQLVQQEAERFESLLSKTIQHGRTDIKDMVFPFKGSARAARFILLVNHQDRQTTPGQQAGSRHTSQAGSNHDDIVGILQYCVW